MPFIEYGGKRILFIHIPKTGGTTIENWLRSLGPVHFYSFGVPTASRCTPQHFRRQDFRDFFADGYFDYAFTMVRNPYHRIASEYRMRAMMQGGGFFKSWPSFSLWLEDNLAKQKSMPFHLDNHLRAQWEFIGSDVEVFRLEDGIEIALEKVSSKLGVAHPMDIPVEASTVAAPIAVNWDRVDRLRVQDHYSTDFREFNYAM
ncbi:MAG: sulfotransferase family 2 domain-containing protein [Alphaproteobacteria bacterium]|nr:sulfotransferase family 2 domain-containing protein [Alphaproteobacteria bacterium]